MIAKGRQIVRKNGKRETHAPAEMGTDLPNFPPEETASLYSMLLCATLLLALYVVEYMLTADLRWASDRKRRWHTDARLVSLCVRQLWSTVSLSVFLAQGGLSDEHPFKDVACGFSAAYVISKIAFDVYHILGTAVFSFIARIRWRTVVLVTAVQFVQPLLAVAVLLALLQQASKLSGEPRALWNSMSTRAFGLAFASWHTIVFGVIGSLILAVVLRRLQGLGYSITGAREDDKASFF